MDPVFLFGAYRAVELLRNCDQIHGLSSDTIARAGATELREQQNAGSMTLPKCLQALCM